MAKTPENAPASPVEAAPKPRRKIVKTRGPRVFVKYDVVDGQGNPIQGAVVRVLGIEKDQMKILNMTLNHTLDGQYLMVEVPILNPTKKEEPQAPELAQAAE